jgi:glycosyltransferase involved in cell wall biosynthesis
MTTSSEVGGEVVSRSALELGKNARILYDARWIGEHGIARFADEIWRRLRPMTSLSDCRRPWDPLDPLFLSTVLWKERPSLFFSPGYNSPAISYSPFVFTLHDLHHLRVPENSNALKRAYYKYCIKPACRRAARVLTVSEYSRCEIIDWAGVPEEKVVNVGNGVGFPFGPTGPAYEPGYPYLLYVGSRKPHKNLVRLLKAFSISGVHKDFRLVLSGLADECLMMLVRELGLVDAVKFVPASSNTALAELYRGARAFLFVSVYEGFGLPPLEAMACGIPVLTSRVCSLPEVMGDAGLLVDPLSIDQIAEGIRRIAGDLSLREELKQRGLDRARLFSWRETARKTQEVLDTAIAQDTERR